MTAEGTESLAELAAQAEQLRERLQRVITMLAGYFVGKKELVELMVICTVAQEPLLIVGPPGTAKSDLVVRFAEALGLPADEYFEYMLTQFTEPSEILGPVDIQELKAGRYIRRVQGKLPTAQVAFLDEIFKSNSAILNTLLTIINERKYYQDGVPMPVALKMLFAATNQVPEFEELAALRDRFTLKIESTNVHPEHFESLLIKGVTNDLGRNLGHKPWAQVGQLADCLKLGKYLAGLMSGWGQAQSSATTAPLVLDQQRYFPATLLRLYRQLLRILANDIGLPISDRKVIKLYRLLRTRAFLLRGGQVEKEDLVLLRYIADTSRDFGPLREKVDRFLKL